jgi:hypothetical protein
MGSLKDKTSPEVVDEDNVTSPIETPKAAVNSTPYLTVLLKYASPLDKFLMVIGSIFGAVNGAALPLMTIVCYFISYDI